MNIPDCKKCRWYEKRMYMEICNLPGWNGWHECRTMRSIGKPCGQEGKFYEEPVSRMRRLLTWLFAAPSDLYQEKSSDKGKSVS